jgi:hypothetical protein
MVARSYAQQTHPTLISLAYSSFSLKDGGGYRVSGYCHRAFSVPHKQFMVGMEGVEPSLESYQDPVLTVILHALESWREDLNLHIHDV